MIDRLSGRAIEVSIAVTQQGPRDSTVSKVVLVHGAMDRAKSFLPVVEYLPDLSVIEYDRRGYGESLPAGIPAVLAEHVDDLLGVMGDEATTVVAHSFGCVVAASAAIQHPGRFLAHARPSGARGNGGRGRHGCPRRASVRIDGG